MRKTRYVMLPVKSWQYIGLLVVSLACLTLGLVSRDREGHAGNLAGPELKHEAPHEVDACPNYNPFIEFAGPKHEALKQSRHDPSREIEFRNSNRFLERNQRTTRDLILRTFKQNTKRSTLEDVRDIRGNRRFIINRESRDDYKTRVHTERRENRESNLRMSSRINRGLETRYEKRGSPNLNQDRRLVDSFKQRSIEDRKRETRIERVNRRTTTIQPGSQNIRRISRNNEDFRSNWVGRKSRALESPNRLELNTRLIKEQRDYRMPLSNLRLNSLNVEQRSKDMRSNQILKSQESRRNMGLRQDRRTLVNRKTETRESREDRSSPILTAERRTRSLEKREIRESFDKRSQNRIAERRSRSTELRQDSINERRSRIDSGERRHLDLRINTENRGIRSKDRNQELIRETSLRRKSLDSRHNREARLDRGTNRRSRVIETAQKQIERVESLGLMRRTVERLTKNHNVLKPMNEVPSKYSWTLEVMRHALVLGLGAFQAISIFDRKGIFLSNLRCQLSRFVF